MPVARLRKETQVSAERLAMIAGLPEQERIVITGVGLTAPNGNNLGEFRDSLLAGRSGVTPYEIRYVGPTLAGVCHFDELRYQKKKEVRRGTRAGSIGIYCAREAVADAGLDWENVDRSTVGIYVGVTEHGNVETENEIYQLKGYDYDTQFWSHHHNPRTVANNPAGEISLNLGITGPHYTLGAACAAGNAGIIQGVQMLRLGECDVALGRRRVGEHSHLRHLRQLPQPGRLGRARRPDQGLAALRRGPQRHRRGRGRAACSCWSGSSDARRRGAKIYGEIVGYAMNSDATDFVLPDPERQAECMRLGAAAGRPERRATSTSSARTPRARPAATSRSARPCGRCSATARRTLFNNTKSFIGHAMGAAGALELAGNLPAFDDGVCHATINLDRLDPGVRAAGPGGRTSRGKSARVDVILNNSFGMLGINSVVIVKRYV